MTSPEHSSLHPTVFHTYSCTFTAVVEDCPQGSCFPSCIHSLAAQNTSPFVSGGQLWRHEPLERREHARLGRQSRVVAEESRPRGSPTAQDFACANRGVVNRTSGCVSMPEFCELLALLLVVGQGQGHDNEGPMRCNIRHGRRLTIVMRAGENEVLRKPLVTF